MIKNKKHTVNQRLAIAEKLIGVLYFEFKEMKAKQETNNNNDK